MSSHFWNIQVLEHRGNRFPAFVTSSSFCFGFSFRMATLAVGRENDTHTQKKNKRMTISSINWSNWKRTLSLPLEDSLMMKPPGRISKNSIINSTKPVSVLKRTKKKSFFCEKKERKRTNENAKWFSGTFRIVHLLFFFASSLLPGFAIYSKQSLAANIFDSPFFFFFFHFVFGSCDFVPALREYGHVFLLFSLFFGSFFSIRFGLVATGLNRIFSRFTGFYWVLLGFIGFYFGFLDVIGGFIKFDPVLLSFTSF